MKKIPVENFFGQIFFWSKIFLLQNHFLGKGMDEKNIG